METHSALIQNTRFSTRDLRPCMSARARCLSHKPYRTAGCFAGHRHDGRRQPRGVLTSIHGMSALAELQMLYKHNRKETGKKEWI